MVRRILLFVALASFSIVSVVTVKVHSVSATKEDCRNTFCVWDQPDYAGTLTKIGGKCKDLDIRSAANTRDSGDGALRVYLRKGCTGISRNFRNHDSAPDLKVVSAKAD
jgi:hypothetical protein